MAGLRRRAGSAPRVELAPWQSSVPWLWCAVSAALFGASTPAAKLIVGHANPWLLAGYLYLGAAAGVLVPMSCRALWSRWRSSSGRTSDLTSGRASPGRRLGLSRQNLARLAGAVGFGGIAAPVLLMWALRLAPAASVGLWLGLEAAATAAIGRLFFKEHLHALGWLAVLLVTVAGAVCATGDISGGVGLLLVLLACVAWGVDNNLTALIDGLRPVQITAVKGVVAGSVNVLLGLAIGAVSSDASAKVAGVVDGSGLTVLLQGLGVGALCYGVSLVLYIQGAQQLGAIRAQLVFASAPLWAVVLAGAWLGEPLGWRHAVSATLLVGGVALLRREQHDHHHAHASVTHTHWHHHDDGHHGHVHAEAKTSEAEVAGPPRGSTVCAGGWHCHVHDHQPIVHTHPHRPDVHHRHDH